jgi:hypothetical protein
MYNLNESHVLGLCYLVFVLFILVNVFIDLFNKSNIEKIYKLFGKSVYVYGYVNNTPARKNTLTKEVEFVLWRAGEQGHQKDYWIRFDSSWWSQFKQNTNETFQS